MPKNRPFWEVKNTSFGTAKPEDDFLHLQYRDEITDPALTETQYFGFSIAEENIFGLCYMWHHPNLGVVTGGAWVWQGFKPYSLQCELFDIVTYMSDDCLANDLHDFILQNGYRASVIEPLQKFRVRYQDEQQNNAFDIHFEAIIAPMMQSSGLHLEQAMRAKGELTLQGKHYVVNCATVRDRSWGTPRPEHHQDLPPMAWMTAVFNDDFIIGCTAFDSLDSNPDWAGTLEIPGGETVKGGWVYKDGEMVPIVSAKKKTLRNKDTLFYESLVMELVDSKGRCFNIKGTACASSGWQAWHNFSSVISLSRWECDGLVTYGDHQECFWQHYIRKFYPKK